MTVLIKGTSGNGLEEYKLPLLLPGTVRTLWRSIRGEGVFDKNG